MADVEAAMMVEVEGWRAPAGTAVAAFLAPTLLTGSPPIISPFSFTFVKSVVLEDLVLH